MDWGQKVFNANLKTQASEWQGAAQQYHSAYQQAIAQGQSPTQAQNTATHPTGVPQWGLFSALTVTSGTGTIYLTT